MILKTKTTLEKARAAQAAAMAELSAARRKASEAKRVALDLAALVDLGEIPADKAKKEIAKYREVEVEVSDIQLRIEGLNAAIVREVEAETRALGEADSHTRSDVDTKAGELVRDLDHWMSTFQALYGRYADLADRFAKAARRGETSVNLAQALNRVQVLTDRPVLVAIDRLRTYAVLTGSEMAASNVRLNRKLERAAKVAIRESEPMPKSAMSFRDE